MAVKKKPRRKSTKPAPEVPDVVHPAQPVAELRSMRLLKAMSDHISDGQQIGELERVAFEGALGNQRFALKVFVSALASHKVDRLTRLLGKLSEIETELFSEKHVKYCETGELIRMFEAVSKETSSDLAFIQSVGEKEDALAVLQQLFEESVGEKGDGAFSKLPAQSRAKLLALFAGVRSRVKKKVADEQATK